MDKNHSYTPATCKQCNARFMARLDSVKLGMGKFCSKKCQVKNQHQNGTNKAARKREKHHLWKGSSITTGGYKLINVGQSHPRAYRGMYVSAHVLIAEGIMGRYLMPHEVVHHINCNPLDNSPSNLSVLTRAEHTRIHKLGVPSRCVSLLDTA